MGAKLKIAFGACFWALFLFFWFEQRWEQNAHNTLVLTAGQSESRDYGKIDEPLKPYLEPGDTSAEPTKIEAPSFITVDVKSASTYAHAEQEVNVGYVMKYNSYVKYAIHVGDNAPAGKYPIAIIFPAYKCELTVEVR